MVANFFAATLEGIRLKTAPTLNQVWAEYGKAKDLKETTRKNYQQRLTYNLPDWLSLPVTEITKEMVEERHRLIPGKATANSTFRTLKALLRYAAIKYEDADGNPLIKKNPCLRLNELGLWHKDKRRSTIIPLTELNNFLRGVHSLQNHTARDYLLVLLFTGLRSYEAACLTWQQIDIKNGTITIPEAVAKNGAELVIPMSQYLWQIMAMRQHAKTSIYVFPGRTPGAHFSNIARSLTAVKATTGLTFTLHDLRRTFATIGDELEIQQGVIKELINHKRNDITESYTTRSTERLRRATQKITDYILSVR